VRLFRRSLRCIVDNGIDPGNLLNDGEPDAKEEHPEVEAVGFGVPGIINPVEGVVVNLTNVKGWHNIPLRSIITEQTGLVCNLENDAKAMAYADNSNNRCNENRQKVPSFRLNACRRRN
jgi:predicted NBD/HSP70 family sugar kinase